jgi:hypothetical protein
MAAKLGIPLVPVHQEDLCKEKIMMAPLREFVDLS